MPPPLSKLHLLPSDVWYNIFFFIATNHPLRPPSGIIPLILTNRWMHSILCICSADNAHLYSALFFYYFDVDAPRRRLGPDFMTSSCCSSELRKRFASIQRIRSPLHYACNNIGLLTEDLCRCYLILLESDHKNAALLFRYANLPTCIADLAQQYLSDDWLSRVSSYPFVSFLLWNLWLVSSHNLLLSEEKDVRSRLQSNVLPCAVAAWIFSDYPPAISPPPSDLRDQSVVISRTSFTVNLFSKSVTFDTPPATPAAILSFCLRANANLLRFAASPAATANPLLTPSVVAVAQAERLLVSSVANLLQEEPILARGHEIQQVRQLSARFDDDWARLDMTYAAGRSPSVHTRLDIRHLLSVISGTWEGRMEYPTYNQYMALREPGVPADNPYDSLYITSLPIMARFQAYYCIEETLKLRVPEDKDSILHAYLPREEEMNIIPTDTGDLRIWDRKERTYAGYLLYDPTKGIPDDVNILDVIIIGQTPLPSAGPEPQYIGRLNLTNGLLILLRNSPLMGKELLRGFVHCNQTFVGRWRTTIPPATTDNWEGPFLMSHRHCEE